MRVFRLVGFLILAVFPPQKLWDKTMDILQLTEYSTMNPLIPGRSNVTPKGHAKGMTMSAMSSELPDESEDTES